MLFSAAAVIEKLGGGTKENKSPHNSRLNSSHPAHTPGAITLIFHSLRLYNLLSLLSSLFLHDCSLTRVYLTLSSLTISWINLVLSLSLSLSLLLLLLLFLSYLTLSSLNRVINLLVISLSSLSISFLCLPYLILPLLFAYLLFSSLILSSLPLPYLPLLSHLIITSSLTPLISSLLL